MQKLLFEKAWDQTISTQDRDRIQHIFNDTKESTEENIELITLWHAVNHKGDLLVTALMHNKTDERFTFNDQPIQYVIKHNVVGEFSFTIPALTLESKTSMPWTFIFPKDYWTNKLGKETGELSLL
ncbi:SLAP domain-containing protein [Bacillaceae bacterium W0354]